MDDAISRQAVLKLLSTMPPEEAITKAMLIQSVKQMDAAQPSGPDNLVKDSPGLVKDLVNDCISRKAAIERATKDHDFYKGATTPADKARRDELLNVMCWLGELPSAQPESAKRTAEEAQNVSDSDLISRKAAIDEIDEWIKAFRENGHKESAADACLIQDGIIQLPSAQPYTNEEIQKIQDLEQTQFYKIHDLAYQEGKADAMRWTSCADRLPEYGEAVLTINDDEDYEINHIIDEDNGEWFYEGAIAWMPLPPYKGE